MSTAASTPVGVEIEGLEVAYGSNRVLRELSLSIAPGEFFALLGPSGSGKSTLLRVLAGFGVAVRGRVRIGGEDVARLPPWRREVGMVFQNYALWPHMSVGANVAFGLEERGWPRQRIAGRVREMLELVGLAGMDQRRPSQLSGGQQQRVALARTLAIEPRVLLLDEPLSNLDARLRESTGIELKRLQRRLSITTVFVTHDQQEAMAIADRLAVLDHGVIQQVGTPRELYDRPVNRFVAGFVGSINVFDASSADQPLDGDTRGLVSLRVDGLGVARLARGALPDAASASRPAAALAFRPHAVRLAEGGGDGLSFDGEIVGAQFLGEFVRYQIAAGCRQVVADVPHSRARAPLEPGTRARFSVAAADLQVLG